MKWCEVYIQRSGSERLRLENALQRYLREVSPAKNPTTQADEATKAEQLIRHPAKIFPCRFVIEVIVNYGDTHLGSLTNGGNPGATTPFGWSRLW